MDVPLVWADVAGMLAGPRNYWLGTTGRGGEPHATPVWGVLVDELFHLYTERRTVKARNIATDPRVVVHLESAEDVLIVHGAAVDLGHPKAVPSVVAALAEKYCQPGDAAYLPTGDASFDVVYAVRPTAALTWRLADFAASQRRWRGD
jgi:hypothetical protein